MANDYSGLLVDRGYSGGTSHHYCPYYTHRMDLKQVKKRVSYIFSGGSHCHHDNFHIYTYLTVIFTLHRNAMMPGPVAFPGCS